MIALERDNMKRFKPKSGDRVYLYYDGKLGREVEGVITRSSGFWVDVAFSPWAGDGERVSIRAVRRSPEHFGGYLRGAGEAGIMRMLGGKGDYYSVSAFGA